jgi:hypothetical protein
MPGRAENRLPKLNGTILNISPYFRRIVSAVHSEHLIRSEHSLSRSLVMVRRVTVASLSSAALLMALSGAAMGQSINVDFNTAAGSGAGVPVNTYGGTAAQPGSWNDVAPSSTAGGTTVAMRGLDGAFNGVLLKHFASDIAGNGVYSSGDFARLMGDYAEGFGTNGQVWMEFTNLQPGAYRVYVAAGLPPSQATYVDSFNQTVNHINFLSLSINNVVQATATTGGSATFFSRGTNYAVFNAAVTAGQTVKVLSLCDSQYFGARTAVNGVQLVRWTSPRIYVNDDAVGLGTGLNWTDAMTSLQDALDLATKSAGVVQEIWVASGEYKPSVNSRGATFKIPSGVKMYGGFGGTETSVNQRVLSELGGGSVLSGSIGVANDVDDNSYHVVTVSDTNAATRLDGFTVLFGNANGTGDLGRGAGIFGTNADLTIANVGVRYNDATIEGGGIYLAGDSSAKLVNTHVARNTAGQFGGGLRNTSTVSVGMVNSTFMENEAGINGGGINSTGSFLIVHNSIFKGNTAAEGGSGSGGAVYVFGAGADSLFRNCTFSFNRTVGGANGSFGGIGLGSSASAEVFNSIFWSNLDGAAGTNKLSEQLGGLAGTTITCSDSILEGATILFGTRNLGLNPSFVDQFGPNNVAGDWDDNLRLAADSPAIDSGNNSLMPSDQYDVDNDGNTGELLPLDILGMHRRTDAFHVADTGIGTRPIVDRGAIEFQPLCRADFNGDQTVDFFDYLDFVAAFDSETPRADYNEDGGVDFFDYLDFVADFDAGCE